MSQADAGHAHPAAVLGPGDRGSLAHQPGPELRADGGRSLRRPRQAAGDHRDPARLGELYDRSLRPDRFTLRNVPGRIADTQDPWEGMRRHATDLADARERLRALSSSRSREGRAGAPASRSQAEILQS